ncbi:hypothetical protein Nepgr_006723 [Nepenthes gracilis]|uniref:Secreted protein n=1 Tax=Nepenthes gracilis TaxID=150966 RepID=A0AAD3S5P5_NEPGR|nr:hypothetical protein Nepgr_006723 [Nepenthes gracilis]
MVVSCRFFICCWSWWFLELLRVDHHSSAGSNPRRGALFPLSADNGQSVFNPVELWVQFDIEVGHFCLELFNMLVLQYSSFPAGVPCCRLARDNGDAIRGHCWRNLSFAADAGSLVFRLVDSHPMQLNGFLRWSVPVDFKIATGVVVLGLLADNHLPDKSSLSTRCNMSLDWTLLLLWFEIRQQAANPACLFSAGGTFLLEEVRVNTTFVFGKFVAETLESDAGSGPNHHGHAPIVRGLVVGSVTPLQLAISLVLPERFFVSFLVIDIGLGLRGSEIPLGLCL